MCSSRSLLCVMLHILFPLTIGLSFLQGLGRRRTGSMPSLVTRHFPCSTWKTVSGMVRFSGSHQHHCRRQTCKTEDTHRKSAVGLTEVTGLFLGERVGWPTRPQPVSVLLMTVLDIIIFHFSSPLTSFFPGTRRCSEMMAIGYYCH